MLSHEFETNKMLNDLENAYFNWCKNLLFE